jgi:putative FmdB family regulatory protein
MPTYEYVCDACSHGFELRQGFHDEPIVVCPKCKKKRVRRVISPAPIIFKGSGFYVNDYKAPMKDDSGGTAKAVAPAPATPAPAPAPAVPVAEKTKKDK